MKDLFFDLAKKAAELNWCTRQFCTTCGNQEFKNEIKKIFDDNQEMIENEISKLEILEFINIRKWDNCLRIAFDYLEKDQIKRLVNKWKTAANQNIELLDFIIFYGIKRYYFLDPEAEYWKNTGIDSALKTENESLIETLIYTFRKDVFESKVFKNLVFKKSKDSKKIEKAVRRIGCQEMIILR